MPQDRPRDLVEHDEVAVTPQRSDLRLVCLDQNHVTEAEGDGAELVMDHLAPALHRQYQRLVAVPEVQFLEGMADELGPRSDQSLHQAQILGLQRLVTQFEVDVEFQAHGIAQAYQLADLAAHEEHLIRFENLAERRPSCIAYVQDPQDGHVVFLSEPALQHGLAHQR